MRSIRQPNDFTCHPSAFAMALGITLDRMLELIGHDGSRVMKASMPFPRKLEAFHTDQIMYVALQLGFACLCFLRRPGMESDEGYVDISGNYWGYDEFLEWLKDKHGVLGVKSKKFESCWHSVAWDGKIVYDPQEDDPKDITDYEVLDFTWVFKLPESP